jgi:hypothetical protein
MAKLKDLVNERVVQHELGHLITLTLFSQLLVSRRRIYELFFGIATGKGMVGSVGKIEILEGTPSCKQVDSIKDDIFPYLINLLSGYAVEILFEKIENIEEEFDKRFCGEPLKSDFYTYKNYLVKLYPFIISDAPVNPDNCVSIAKDYINFLKINFEDRLSETCNYLMELEVECFLNEDKSEIRITGKVLREIISKIESTMVKEFLDAARAWYKEVLASHILQFKNCE